MPIVLTSQDPIDVPGELNGDQLQFVGLSEVQKWSVFESYASSKLSDNDADLLAPFETSFEISLAAQCSKELSTPCTRYDLLRAYVDRCLSGTSNVAMVRSALMALAELMGREWVGVIALTEFCRMGEGLSAGGETRPIALEEIFDSGLVTVSQGYVSFRHELFQHFFEAESLLKTAPNLGLAEQLAKPSRRHLREFVLAAIKDTTLLSSCLRAIAGADTLVACIRGQVGREARTVVLRDITNILRRSELPQIDWSKYLRNIEIALRNNDDITPVLNDSADARQAERYERSILEAIGCLLTDGLFVDEIMALIAETDALLEEKVNAASESQKERQKLAGEMFWNVYVHSDRAYSTAAIVQACRNNFWRKENAAVCDKVVSMWSDLEELTPGQLYLLCCLLHRHGNTSPPGLAKFLDRCWRSGPGHLRHACLFMLYSYVGVLQGEELAAVKAVLSSFETKDIWLSTDLVENLAAFDLLEPCVDRDDAAKGIRELLADPTQAEANARAYSVICRCFEGVFQGVYWEPFQALPDCDRVRLLVMASTRPFEFSGFFGSCDDWILSELLKLNDPAALPAFITWASRIESDTPVVQHTTACYFHACRGCARLSKTPPQLEALPTSDHRAWQIYGEIIFWTYRSGVADEDRLANCDRLWSSLVHEYPFEAVDPLMRFDTMSFEKGEVDEWIQRHKQPIREILEFGLRNRERLTTIFDRYRPGNLIPLTEFIIRTLADVGHQTSTHRLESFVDSEFADMAIATLRSLNSRRASSAPPEAA